MDVIGRVISSFRFVRPIQKHYFYNSKTSGGRLKQVSDSESASKNESYTNEGLFLKTTLK